MHAERGTIRHATYRGTILGEVVKWGSKGKVMASNREVIGIDKHQLRDTGGGGVWTVGSTQPRPTVYRLVPVPVRGGWGLCGAS